MFRTVFAFLTLVFFSFATTTLQAGEARSLNPKEPDNAKPNISETTKASPKICVVLAGGGALGTVHVGVLKFLEEQQIPIHCITGTSMGAIIGGLYASGYTADELAAVINSTNWLDIFKDRAPRSEKSYQRKLDDLNFLVKYSLRMADNGKIVFPRGIIQGNKIDLSFLELTLRSRHINNFDDLPIPYRAVAVDLETGEEVILSSGSLSKAMRASMSIPGVFPPTELDNRMLVDGGVINNLPIDVARGLGADIIIAVNIEKELKKKAELISALDVAGQVTQLLIKQNMDLQLTYLTEKDVVIKPDVKGYTSASFDKTRELIEPGYEAAKKMLPELHPFAIGVTEYAQFRQQQIVPEPEAELISFIEIDNRSGINDAIIRKKLVTRLDEPLDTDSLKQDLIRLTGLGFFDKVLFEIAERDDQTGVIVSVFGPNASLLADSGTAADPVNMAEQDARPSNGDSSLSDPSATETVTAQLESYSSIPNSVQFGIALEDDFNGESEYSLGLRYRRIPVTSKGGELLVDFQIGVRAKAQAVLFQPIDEEAKFFVSPVIAYNARNIPVFENNNQLANIRLREGDIGVDVGRQFGTVGEIRAGVRRGVAYADELTGVTDITLGNFQSGYYFLSASYDTIDNVDFPKSGMLVDATLTDSTKSLSADADFRLFEFDFVWANSWNNTTVLLSSSTNLNLDDQETIQGLFTLGGFRSLSGYKRDELVANNYMLHRASLFHEWRKGGSGIFNVPFYAGISFEAAGLFESNDDIFSNEQDHIFGGSVFLGAETILGPVFLAYGRSDDDNQSLYLFIGRNL